MERRERKGVVFVYSVEEATWPLFLVRLGERGGVSWKKESSKKEGSTTNYTVLLKKRGFKSHKPASCQTAETNYGNYETPCSNQDWRIR